MPPASAETVRAGAGAACAARPEKGFEADQPVPSGPVLSFGLFENPSHFTIAPGITVRCAQCCRASARRSMGKKGVLYSGAECKNTPGCPRVSGVWNKPVECKKAGLKNAIRFFKNVSPAPARGDDRAGHHCPVRPMLSGLCPTIYGQKRSIVFRRRIKGYSRLPASTRDVEQTYGRLKGRS
jgi:hypothetical protein